MTIPLGVLVPAARYRRIMAGEFRHWHSLALRWEAEFGVQMVLAPPQQVDLRAGHMRGLRAGPDLWLEVTCEPPRLYHNRVVRPLPEEARALRDLNGSDQVLLFNETNRWDRGMVYAMLRSQPELWPLVPETEAYPGVHEEWLEAGCPVLAAPARRALTDGAYLLERMERRLRYRRLGGRATGVRLAEENGLSEGLLPDNVRWASRLSGRPVGPDGPVEWRLYVQRTESLDWAVVGAVAKRDVLRATRVERSWELYEALALTFGSEAAGLSEQLRDGAVAVADALSCFMPGVVHGCLDFWIDRNLQPTLVDLAGHYRLDWLERAGQLAAVDRILTLPARFARMVTVRGVRRLNVGTVDVRPGVGHGTGTPGQLLD